MEYDDKISGMTREELCWELTALKARLAKLEFIEAERSAAEQELRASEERFRMVVECLSEGLLITDLDDVVQYVNSRMSELTGYGAEEMIGRPAYELLLPPDQWPDLHARNKQRGEGQSDYYEVEIVRKDGTTFWAATHAMPYLDAEGGIIGTLGATTDISDRVEADRKLRTSLDEKEVLLKEIHHRVKNNLQVVSSLLSLQAGHFTDEQIRAAFTDSQNRIRSMALIHERLYRSTDLARIDMGQYIQDLAHGLFSSYGGVDREISLRVEVAAVEFDVDQAMPCGLIVNELISNALKYAFADRERGEVFVGVAERGDGRLELVVRDDGVGFAPDFDYTQSPSLGLRLVHTLVRQLRGELEVGGSGGVEFKIVITLPDTD